MPCGESEWWTAAPRPLRERTSSPPRSLATSPSVASSPLAYLPMPWSRKPSSRSARSSTLTRTRLLSIHWPTLAPDRKPLPSASLLLPNRDTEVALDLVLERLEENTTHPNFELIVIDDGSTDRSLEILRRWRDSGRFSSFTLLEREHAGVVESLNAGLQAAVGEVVVQLDSDCSVETPGWLERMAFALASEERVGVVTGEVVMDSGQIQTCGVNLFGPEGFHDRPTRITEPAGRRNWHFRVSRYDEGTRPEERAVAEVDSGIGCFMAYRREEALEVGGYDTGFSPLWFDDIDLCVSLRRHGKKAFFLPGLRAVHHYGLSKGQARGRMWKAARKVKRVLPHRARLALVRGIGFDSPKGAVRARFDHHHAYWQEKWGWHPLNPDVEEIKRRYGGTEICWASEPELTDAGREIAERLEAGTRSAGTAPAHG